jgi:hypothetical protein
MRMIGTISVMPESAVNKRWRYIGFDCAYFLLKNDSKGPTTRYYVWSQVTERALHRTARLLWTVQGAVNV